MLAPGTLIRIPPKVREENAIMAKLGIVERTESGRVKIVYKGAILPERATESQRRYQKRYGEFIWADEEDLK